CRDFSSGAGCVYYAFRIFSQAFIFAFLKVAVKATCLTRRFVSRCAVSVEAHYREFFRADKC
ncbi:hypothetical protein, partial [Pantoea eucrina]|uniref:hypothetical protein n=1 Tax=Pantoea eucrina TaxID=472693 RepID=UPI001B80D09C